MTFTIERTTEDGLSRSVYTFDVDVALGIVSLVEVRVASISHQSRETKRHRKWTVRAAWARRGHERPHRSALLTDPFVPDDVLAEAREYVANRIRFVLPT